MTAYPPGTVAVATVRGVPGVRVFRLRKAWSTSSPTGNAVSEAIYDASGDVTDVRPLVVLDLSEYDRINAPQALRRLADHLTGPDNVFGRIARDIAAQIEAQTRPPKPAEPTNRYAVVCDGSGEEWLRDRRGDWCQVNHPTYGTRVRHWGDIDAVEVLSEGVA